MWLRTRKFFKNKFSSFVSISTISALMSRQNVWKKSMTHFHMYIIKALKPTGFIFVTLQSRVPIMRLILQAWLLLFGPLSSYLYLDCFRWSFVSAYHGFHPICQEMSYNTIAIQTVMNPIGRACVGCVRLPKGKSNK